VSAAVDALTQRGLMSRSDVLGDQRATTLSLTAGGYALLSRVETDMTERLNQLSERTPDATQLLESLVWMGAAIDELRAETSPQEQPT
jgi:DNA-binding MarR family transcriptional regulator